MRISGHRMMMMMAAAPPAAAAKTFSKTALELYRDCLRLVRHIAGSSPKGLQLRRVVRLEFRKNRAEMDPARVDALKSNAVRALANYLMLEAASKDPRLQDRITAFASSAAQSMNSDPVSTSTPVAPK